MWAVSWHHGIIQLWVNWGPLIWMRWTKYPGLFKGRCSIEPLWKTSAEKIYFMFVFGCYVYMSLFSKCIKRQFENKWRKRCTPCFFFCMHVSFFKVHLETMNMNTSDVICKRYTSFLLSKYARLLCESVLFENKWLKRSSSCLCLVSMYTCLFFSKCIETIYKRVCTCYHLCSVELASAELSKVNARQD